MTFRQMNNSKKPLPFSCLNARGLDSPPLQYGANILQYREPFRITGARGARMDKDRSGGGISTSDANDMESSHLHQIINEPLRFETLLTFCRPCLSISHQHPVRARRKTPFVLLLSFSIWTGVFLLFSTRIGFGHENVDLYRSRCRIFGHGFERLFQVVCEGDR